MPTSKAAKKTPNPKQEFEMVEAKYAGMAEAIAKTWPHTRWPVTLAVLVTAGANPNLVPVDEAFDEYGYYQMDWQLGTKTKYPWPGEAVRKDAQIAFAWEVLRGSIDWEADNAVVSE